MDSESWLYILDLQRSSPAHTLGLQRSCPGHTLDPHRSSPARVGSEQGLQLVRRRVLAKETAMAHCSLEVLEDCGVDGHGQV